MLSSISNFNSLQRLRFFLAIFFIVMALGVAAVLRRSGTVTGLPEDVFYMNKLNPAGPFDVLVLGDSRAMLAISPKALADTLPGRHVFNYSFAGGSFTPDYLESVNALVSTHSLLLVGITPLTLFPHNSSFTVYKGKTPYEKWEIKIFGKFLGWFDPFHSPDVKKFFGQPPEYRIFHADGWSSARYRDASPDSYEKDFYRIQYEDGKPTGQSINDFLEIVKSWRSAGIWVVGFRPPVPSDMALLEDQISGFDQEKFIRAFEKSGGRWLYLNNDSYPTYDGVHVTETSAIQLSRDIGFQIAAMEKKAIKGR